MNSKINNFIKTTATCYAIFFGFLLSVLIGILISVITLLAIDKENFFIGFIGSIFIGTPLGLILTYITIGGVIWAIILFIMYFYLQKEEFVPRKRKIIIGISFIGILAMIFSIPGFICVILFYKKAKTFELKKS